MQHDPFYERTDAADRETERLRSSHDGRDSESAEQSPSQRQPLRRLQRTRGNQAVQRAMARTDGADRGPDIRLGDPNSAAEREAEAVAERVVAGSQAPADRQRPAGRTPTVRRTADGSGGGERAPDIVSDVVASSGRPLPSGVRAGMEADIGADFGDVAVHTGPRAAASATAVDARAYAVGSNVVFNSGEYAPDTLAGRAVLAHELTHVAQHGGDIYRLQRLDFGAMLATGKQLFQGGQGVVAGISQIAQGNLAGGAQQLFAGGGQVLQQGAQAATMAQEVYETGEDLVGGAKQLMTVRAQMKAQAAAATKEMRAQTQTAIKELQVSTDPMALLTSTIQEIQSLVTSFLDDDYESGFGDLLDEVTELTGGEDIESITGVPGADQLLKTAVSVVQQCLGPKRTLLVGAMRNVGRLVKTAATAAATADTDSLRAQFTNSRDVLSNHALAASQAVQSELEAEGMTEAAEALEAGTKIASTVAAMAPPSLDGLRKQATDGGAAALGKASANPADTAEAAGAGAEKLAGFIDEQSGGA